MVLVRAPLCHPILRQKRLLALPPSGSHRMTHDKRANLQFPALCCANEAATVPETRQVLICLGTSDCMNKAVQTIDLTDGC